ncbi:MAG TPA: biosynthetic-type acetolactate synthase large subunit [Gemmatimonadales bacterium]|nr:biosynthetic-type acetolactate synthase large subunit [Gemmatimonadales bacterium]
MTEVLTGSQILCRELLAAGVDVIFGYPGGAIMPFYHALPEYPALRHILTRHEQAAAHAADGFARASGGERVGVCVATSGPGATNLVTGLATAHMDSSPVLAITGQVGRPMIGRDAFQETDIIGITLPITKYNHLVQDVSELADRVREAIGIALDGRPGPVLLDVPKDVQNQRAAYTPPASRPGARREPRTPPLDQAIREAAELIAKAERPLIMIGHGVILSSAYGEVKALAEKTGIPVITTLLGISAFPESHPLHLGMPGMHGEVHVNRAIQQADLIVGIGLRFDDRVTGNTAAFAPRAKIIHIELDRSEIGKNIPVAVGIVGDAKLLTGRLVAAVKPRRAEPWIAEIKGFVRPRAEAFSGDLSPEAILAAIHETTGGQCTIVTDVGQHQMWVAKHYPYQRANTHITSGGLGTMGFAVPAAMGVHLARPGELVWAISGDGGFQMNMAEMATMIQEGLSVKMAIFNNGYLGMVRQWQQFFHEKRYSCTPIWSPDYVKLAEAYGIAGWRVENRAQLENVVERANAERGPALVEFVIAQEANVYPMIPPGGSLSDPIEARPAPTPAD